MRRLSNASKKKWGRGVIKLPAPIEGIVVFLVIKKEFLLRKSRKQSVELGRATIRREEKAVTQS